MKPDVNALISVIIPTFNREELIAETLNSLLNQTYIHWEAIVVDDLSTDCTKEKILEYQAKDERIKFFERNIALKGGSVCRNIGISKAKGSYIVFLDSDDLLAPFCFEQRINAMLDFPQLDFGVFHAETFLKKPGDGKLHTVYLSSRHHLYHFIAGHSIWQTACPIWRKDFVKNIEGFNEKYQRFQDTEFHFRALNSDGVSYKAFYKLKPDCYYRLTYPTRPTSFWDAVVINNILYLEEVTAISMEKLDRNLYKTAITILIFYAVTYAVKAHKNQANFFLNAINTLPVKQNLSAFNFALCKAVLVAHTIHLFAVKIFKGAVSRIIYFRISGYIKKLV